MAGELINSVRELELRVERLEKLISQLDSRQLNRIWSEIQTLWARIKR